MVSIIEFPSFCQISVLFEGVKYQFFISEQPVYLFLSETESYKKIAMIFPFMGSAFFQHHINRFYWLKTTGLSYIVHDEIFWVLC